MAVSKLAIRNVRVVEDAAFAPAADINVLLGDNGSGKTSVLEALYLLSTGRSFTSARLEHLVRHGTEGLRVVATLEESGSSRVAGVERRLGAAPELHLDGRRIDGFAKLAQRLPTQVIYPQSDDLISGGPTHRRRFVDWGVFHVEHGFMACWREYQRALNQRNAALRTAASAGETAAWDHILDRAGSQLAEFRGRYVQALSAYAAALGDRLFDDGSIELQLNRGWAAELPLGEALVKSFERDRRTHSTNVGPHRAELRIRYADHEARSTVSRGQQKLLVYALKLAQIAHLWERHQRRTMLLLDDLPSELDPQARARVFDVLKGVTGQLFITAIERRQLLPLLDDVPATVFHVEQGGVSELV